MIFKRNGTSTIIRDLVNPKEGAGIPAPFFGTHRLVNEQELVVVIFLVKKKRKSQLILVGFILSLSVLLTGCTSNSGNSTNSAQASTPTSAEPKVGLAIGNQAPDFTITMNDGKTIKLSDLKGQPVFLNFWASWCPPCKQEMPDIEKISKEQHSVQIIAVNIKETPMEVRSFLNANGYTFPVGYDPKGEISLQYMATGIPTSYGIDRNGIIRYLIQGPLTYAQLKKWFTTLENIQ